MTNWLLRVRIQELEVKGRMTEITMRKNFSKNKNKKLIVANWKMNPVGLRDARKIFATLKRKSLRLRHAVPVICPPTLFLAELAGDYRGGKFLFGAQDVSVVTNDSTLASGELTGEISAKMLSDVGARFVIIGHSERRALLDTDHVVASKISAVLAGGLTPILCIGEKSRDESGEYLRFIESQLRSSLGKITKKEIEHIVIAYEPVWAIGYGHSAMSSREIHQMTIFIRKVLARMFDKKTAMAVSILYGGSVDADNCDEVLRVGEVDGLLVGRASLNPYVFADILRCAG